MSCFQTCTTETKNNHQFRHRKSVFKNVPEKRISTHLDIAQQIHN